MRPFKPMQDCGRARSAQDPSASAPRRNRMEDRGDKVRRLSASPRIIQKVVFRHASLSRRNDQAPKSLCLSSAFRGRLPYVAPFLGWLPRPRAAQFRAGCNAQRSMCRLAPKAHFSVRLF